MSEVLRGAIDTLRRSHKCAPKASQQELQQDLRFANVKRLKSPLLVILEAFKPRKRQTKGAKKRDIVRVP